MAENIKRKIIAFQVARSGNEIYTPALLFSFGKQVRSLFLEHHWQKELLGWCNKHIKGYLKTLFIQTSITSLKVVIGLKDYYYIFYSTFETKSALLVCIIISGKRLNFTNLCNKR